jgi:hypothetical protein
MEKVEREGFNGTLCDESDESFGITMPCILLKISITL